ncbi:MAG: hypothetical protein HY255_02070 [Betaproteobacteria bacterium]|nr:hypothetical protein [Betaproteobacteria bacterium]
MNGFFRSSLVAALAITAVEGYAQGIAFVTDVKGAATIDAGKATLMAELKKGARVGCAKECSVGVMYLQSGKEFVIKGPGDFIVGDSEVNAKIGAPPMVRETQWKVSAQTVAQVAQTSSASIRMRAIGTAAAKAEEKLPADRLLYPTETRVASLQPAFRWAATNEKGPFDFELKAGEAGKSVYKVKASATSVKLPNNLKLQPDAEYRWSVKTGSADVGAASFKTLPAYSLEITQKRKPDDKAQFSDWLLYALTLKELGADQDANEVWARLAKDRPDMPELASLAK